MKTLTTTTTTTSVATENVNIVRTSNKLVLNISNISKDNELVIFAYLVGKIKRNYGKIEAAAQSSKISIVANKAAMNVALTFFASDVFNDKTSEDIGSVKSLMTSISNVSISEMISDVAANQEYYKKAIPSLDSFLI